MAERDIKKMRLEKVYPLLVQKAERKGRTKDEVDEAVCWLTGYTREQLEEQLENGADYQSFFENAPQIHPDAVWIQGVVCGVRVEDIKDPLIQKIRYLDKLVDELAKGKPLEKVLRRNQPGASSVPRRSETGGRKPASVDAYIEAQDENVRPYLEKVRSCIHNAIPDAEERISYAMPTFWKKKNVIHFAAAKKHIGLYPGPDAVAAFKNELRGFKTSKGAVQIPFHEELPLELIAEIAVWSYRHVTGECGSNDSGQTE